jgi:hypothetical protein
MKFFKVLKFAVCILFVGCFMGLFSGITEASVYRNVNGLPCWQGNPNYPFWAMGSAGGSFLDLDSARVIHADKEGITIQFRSYSCMYSENVTKIGALPWQYHGIYVRASKVNGNATFDTYLDGWKKDEKYWASPYGHAIAKMVHAALTKAEETGKVEPGYFPYGKAPSMVVLHHAIYGEVPINLLKSQVIPKHAMSLLAKPAADSESTGTLEAGEAANIIDYELHTYPRRYIYSYQGKLYGFLSYHGEGVYSVLGENGQVEYLRTSTNQIYTNADLWLCVSNQNGAEGWVPVMGGDDWELTRLYGIFHPLSDR